MTKLAWLLVVALLLSIALNGLQSQTNATERRQHAERVKYFYNWDYRAEIVKERETGHVWLRLRTPAGFQVHEFGQVCPKELKL